MARDDRQQTRLPVRQEERPLARIPEREGDFWSASPFHLMRRMQEDMDRLFGSFFGQPLGGWSGAPQALTAWSPSVDVYETENEIVAKVEAPGVQPEDLEITCTEDALFIRGETRREEEREERGWHRSERRYGQFQRQIPLPSGIRADEARADFRNGILEVRIPKTEEARQKRRRIPITGTAGAKGGEAGSAQGQAQGGKK